MLKLVARRLVLLVPTLLLVSFGVFSLMSLLPGDAATTLAGGVNARPERIAEIRAELGLDDPFLVRYGDWLGDVVRLDLGRSVISGDEVVDEIRFRLPVTLSIVAGSVLVGLALAIPIGLWSGARHGGWVDRVLLFVTSGGLAIPNFVLAVVLVRYLSNELGWFPAIGFVRPTSGPGFNIEEWLRSITLSCLALGIGIAARLARQVRAGVIDTLDEPYIRTAWAKGCSPSRVIGRHVFKNAAIPTVTVAGLIIGAMLGGTVIIERIFSAPGLGDYLVRAITSNDVPVIQGMVVMFVMAFTLINLLVDVIYGWLNPKIEIS